MQLIDGVCQNHGPLVFLAGLLLVKKYTQVLVDRTIPPFS